MFEKEFDAIWAAQKIHHPDLLTDTLHDRVRKTIYYQRPLRLPRQAIGTCELEPKRRRWPWHPLLNQVKPDQLEQLKKAQQYLRDLDTVLVEETMLSE